MTDRNSSITFLAGFIVGGLFGSALALLMAPQSGEDTRAQIRDRGLELKGQAEERVADARARVDSVATDVRQRTEDVQERVAKVQEQGRATIEEQTGKVRDFADKAKARVAKVA